MERNPRIGAALQAALQADVIRNLVEPQRMLLSDEPERLRSMRKARYASMMRAVLEEGEVSARTRLQVREARWRGERPARPYSRRAGSARAACGGRRPTAHRPPLAAHRI
eukprot:7319459-Prymnesium_polylepis.1